jgi:hypothetical protein
LRRETNEALRGVNAELAVAAGVFEERIAVQPCLDRRLEQVGALITNARQSHRLPDIGEIGRPPVRPIQSAAWTTATSRGLVSKFPEDQQQTMSVHHSQSASYAEDVQDEQDMWATLRLLEHAPGHIDGALLSDAIVILERLRFRSFLNGLDAQQLFDTATSLKLKPDYFILAEAGERFDRTVMLERVRARPVCKPLLVDGQPLPS